MMKTNHCKKVLIGIRRTEGDMSIFMNANKAKEFHKDTGVWRGTVKSAQCS